MLKEKKEDFAERLKGETVIADKGYISKDFAEEMRKRGVVFIAVKRENMIKSDEEAEYYIPLQIEKEDRNTILSCRKSVKFIKAVSRKGLAVKIILGLLAFNFYQLMG